MDPVLFNSLPYAFPIGDHSCTYLSVRPAIGRYMIPSNYVHSNHLFFKMMVSVQKLIALSYAYFIPIRHNFLFILPDRWKKKKQSRRIISPCHSRRQVLLIGAAFLCFCRVEKGITPALPSQNRPCNFPAAGSSQDLFPRNVLSHFWHSSASIHMVVIRHLSSVPYLLTEYHPV